MLVTQSTSTENQPAPRAGEKAPRLMSLDALRGFDMFWIIGADDLVQAIHHLSQAGWANFLGRQLDHSVWQGVTFYDLIFPLFVFMVGVSIVFSLSRSIADGGKASAYRRIITRTVILYVLGLFYYGGINQGLEHVRLLGVLQRIALAYGASSILFLHFRTRGLIAWCAGLLIGYCLVMALIPVPGVGAGHYEEGMNLANYIDSRCLPFRKWDGDHDPEGLLSTLPAIATCLLGVLTGIFLRNKSVPDQRKVLLLAGAGAVSVALGFLWGLQFPVIKKIWTSSYVLVAGGYSALMLAAFYQIIEIWKFRSWAVPFVWIGMNPITIYMAHNLLDFQAIAQRLAGGPVADVLGAYSQLALCAVVILLTFLLARFLYRRQIFIRI